MKGSVLLALLWFVSACAAPLHAKRAAAALKDPKAVVEEMTKLVEGDDVAGALAAGVQGGLDQPARTAFAQGMFRQLVGDGLCIRAAELGKTFGLGTRYGQTAVECIKKGSLFEAAAMACKADVTEGYARDLDRAIEASMEPLAGEARYSALEVLLDSPCDVSESLAKAWFPKMLEAPAGLRLGRMILDKAKAHAWPWDLQPMFRDLLKAAIAFDADSEADSVMGEDAYAPDDGDVELYLRYEIAHLRCDAAATLVASRRLGAAKIESVLSDAKCSGAAYVGLSWSIKDPDAPAWFEAALRHGKYRLARAVADKLKDPKPAVEQAEKAALDGGDFDASMDFPARDGESVEQKQDRVLQGALDRNDEWFVVRWNTYAQNGVKPARRDGWIERAYLHAMFRKDWKMAADCIARHSVAASAAQGERLAFEEALRAEDADTAVDLARAYALDDDCRKRAALLRARKLQEAERAKAKARAAKEKRLRKESGDWYPTP